MEITCNYRGPEICVELEGITGREIINTGLVRARISPWFSSNESDILSKTFIVMEKMPMCQRHNFDDNIPGINGIQF